MTIRLASVCVLMTVLAACGGSTPPQTQAPVTPPTPDPAPDPAPITYRTLDSTAAQTSTLGGTGLLSARNAGSLSIVMTSGTLTHNTGATTVEAGSIVLRDTNGPNAAGVLIGADATITPDPGPLGSDYAFAGAYQLSSTQGGTTTDITGIGGVVTRAVDMPSGGGATYVGDAQGFILQGDASTTLNDGRVIVSANFINDSVTVTADRFSAVDDRTGLATTAPIDLVRASSLDISGNSFAGSTYETELAGATVNLTGDRTTALTQGTFFGFDTATGEPAEAGGTILIQGRDATIGAVFLAD